MLLRIGTHIILSTLIFVNRKKKCKTATFPQLTHFFIQIYMYNQNRNKILSHHINDNEHFMFVVKINLLKSVHILLKAVFLSLLVCNIYLPVLVTT